MDSLEKVLAVWLERQRHCLRTGKLEKGRVQRLNSILPRWQRGGGSAGQGQNLLAGDAAPIEALLTGTRSNAPIDDRTV